MIPLRTRIHEEPKRISSRNFVFNGLEKLLGRTAYDGVRLAFGFQDPVDKLPAPFFPVGKIEGKVLYFVEGGLRELRKDFVDVFYFLCSGLRKLFLPHVNIEIEIDYEGGRV